MNIIFLGTPPFIQPIRDALAKHFTLVDSLNNADLAVVAAYGKILTQEELSLPKHGCINVHPSLLPKYRGPSPIQTAILNGDPVSGITIIKMDKEVDHGPIIYQEQMELSSRDNFDILSKKMFLRSSEVLPKIIEDFVDGKIKPIEQNHHDASFCDRLTRESGYFNIDNPPTLEQFDRMVRAYYPWPGVWTHWSPTGRSPEDQQTRSGEAKIVKFYPGGLIHPDLIGIQMEGKKIMPYKDFLNGYPDFPLEITQLR